MPVFFLLSGYLLSAIYGAQNRNVRLRSFALSRLGRIWPLWMLFSLAWSVFFLINEEQYDWVLAGFLLSTLFLLWISPFHYDSFVGGAWSIQIEIALYAIFFPLRKLGSSQILLVAIAVNLAGIALSFADMNGFSVFDALRRLTLQSGFNFFVMGILASRLFSGKMHGIKRYDFYQISSPKQSLKMGSLALIVLWMGSFLFTPYYGGNSVEAMGFIFISVFLAILITSQEKLGNLVSYLGRRSYFVFFIHFLLLAILPNSPFDNGISALLAAPVVILFVLAVSYAPSELSYRYFESPLREKIRNS